MSTWSGLEESLEYTDKALEYAQTIGDDLAVANFLNNKAVALKSLERFEEAMDCLIKIEIKLSLERKQISATAISISPKC